MTAWPSAGVDRRNAIVAGKLEVNIVLVATPPHQAAYLSRSFKTGWHGMR
jgi:hypothetical protein